MTAISQTLQGFKVKIGIDWIVCHAFCPISTDPNTLSKSAKFKKLGVSRVSNWKRNDNKACNDYTLTIQDPTPATLAAIEAQGVELGELLKIEFFIDCYRKASKSNADLSAMANYLADTLDFKSTATEQINCNYSDVSSCTSEEMLGGEFSRVSLTTTMYYGNNHIAGRVYYKTTDNKAQLPTNDHRARLEFTTQGELLPCKTVADLSGVDWQAWIFEGLGYCPREREGGRPLLSRQFAPNSKRFDKDGKPIEPARRRPIFPDTQRLNDTLKKAFVRQLEECGKEWLSW